MCVCVCVCLLSMWMRDEERKYLFCDQKKRMFLWLPKKNESSTNGFATLRMSLDSPLLNTFRIECSRSRKNYEYVELEPGIFVVYNSDVNVLPVSRVVDMNDYFYDETLNVHLYEKITCTMVRYELFVKRLLTNWEELVVVVPPT